MVKGRCRNSTHFVKASELDVQFNEVAAQLRGIRVAGKGGFIVLHGPAVVMGGHQGLTSLRGQCRVGI